MLKAGTLVLLLLQFPIGAASAQVPAAPSDSTPPPDPLARTGQQIAPVVITATRNPRKLFDVPRAVTVVTEADLNRRPIGSAVSLFTGLPGLDVSGVGPNQGRPVIRGFTGQRVLLLEDGLRVGNRRRQQDFGALPSLIDQRALARVEVIRGPASVLYGSDAIGGVVNMVSSGLPSLASGDQVRGVLGVGFSGGSAGTVSPSASIAGRKGRVAFRFDADYRNADPYQAPSGQFGDLVLDQAVTVQGTGITDRHLRGNVSVDIASGQKLFAKYRSYHANDAGFGFVDPGLLGPFEPMVNIRYPLQRVNRGTVGYRGNGLGLSVADRVDVSIYHSDNRRHLDQDIFVPFGPQTPDGAGLAVSTRNYTDVSSTGVRLEAARRLGGSHLVTWGVDFNHDNSTGTDSSTSTVVGFGPPHAAVSNTPSLPDARYQSLGLFLQDEVGLSSRLSLVVGARYQSNTAESFRTPGLDEPPARSSDAAAVWATNVLYRLGDDVRLIASASRGFRSPNLVERFFNGVLPEGNAFQSRSLDLKSESATEIEVGIRVRRPGWSFEVFAFRNDLDDGIRVAPTGDTIRGFPEYQNVNIERLRVRGVEAAFTATPFRGATLLANYTNMSQSDVDQPLLPVGDGYGDKLVLTGRYRIPSGRAWAGIRLRHQGSRVASLAAASIVGAATPGFTVLDLDFGGIPLQWGQGVTIFTATLQNLTNELYAESGNAGFFRPSPGRRMVFAIKTTI